MRLITDETIHHLTRRAAASERVYGQHANLYETLGAVRLEYREVEEAIQARDTQAVYAELLDLANAAIRGAQALEDSAS